MSAFEPAESAAPETLHDAARRGDADAVNRLLSAGAEVNARDAKGRTPLICAAREGHADAVRHLLKWGAEVNAVPITGGTALREAVREGRAKVVRLLLAQNADPALVAPPRPPTPEQEANGARARGELERITRGMDARIRRLGLEEALKVREKSYHQPAPQRLLSNAIMAKSLETLRVLLEAGYAPDPPDDGQTYFMTPLKFAASLGDAEAVRLLLQFGAKVRGGDELTGAVMKNKAEIARLLLDAGADPNAGDENGEGMAPLTAATFYGNAPLIEVMGRYGAKPDKQTLAMARGKPEILALMRRLQGTHWHEAARQGDLAAVSTALDEGANIEAVSETGETGLMAAGDSPAKRDGAFSCRARGVHLCGEPVRRNGLASGGQRGRRGNRLPFAPIRGERCGAK